MEPGWFTPYEQWVMAKRSAGTKYMLLAGNLIAKIKSGAYPAGSLLPTESQLGEQFGVSRIGIGGRP